MPALSALAPLRSRLLEVHDLTSASCVLEWDQKTFMPPGGAAARGRQFATLSRLAHERFTDKEVGRLLDQAERETASLPPDSDEASLVRVTRRLYEQSIRIPSALVTEFEEHKARSYQAWSEALPASDFARVLPHLEKAVELRRRWADCTPGYASVADPLIALLDYGATAASLRALFSALRARLVPLVRAIAARAPADDSFLRRDASSSSGEPPFARDVLTAYGFDFDRGRIDLTLHAFQTTFSLGDVRIATRPAGASITASLFPTLHECGHALYEQGIRAELDGTPLGKGTSAGVHESQSRLWENLVGRSRGFWEHFYPAFQRAHSAQLGDVGVDAFYRAINRVERSLLRGPADEVTYNLHIFLRFELELDLLEGRVEVKDVARVWRERFERDFGIPVPDDRHGVLQDVHWYNGALGGEFQSYALGNVMSAQFFAAAVRAEPSIPGEIARGQFATLRRWLTDNVYQHGAKFTADELVRRATGSAISIEPYCEYLRSKYLPLYALKE